MARDADSADRSLNLRNGLCIHRFIRAWRNHAFLRKTESVFLLAPLSWIPQAHALPSPILFEENNPSDLDRFFNFFACFFPTSQNPVGGF
jgi:hypothetical protein